MRRTAVLFILLALGAVGLWAVLARRESRLPSLPEKETSSKEAMVAPLPGEPGETAAGETGTPVREFMEPAVRGFVRRADDDTPVKGARVILFRFGGSSTIRATTNAEGFFEFTDTGRDVFGLLISKEGIGALRVEPVRAATGAPIHLLSSGGTLYGRVVTAPDKSPVLRYRIRAARTRYAGPGEFDHHRVIHHQLLPDDFAADSLEVKDSDGRFRFTGLEPATYVLLVYPEGDRAPAFENGGKGWYHWDAGFCVEPGKEAGPVEIVLGAPGSIRVKVVDAGTGDPLLGVSFYSNLRIARRHVNVPVTPMRAGADGVYELPAALNEAGRLERIDFTLEKAGYGTVSDIPSGHVDRAIVTVAMGKAARIRGTVLGPAGRPVAGAKVIVMEDAGEQVLAGVQTDSEGRYESGPVPGGGTLSVRVFDSTRGNLLGVAPVTLAFGEERVLDFGSGKTAAVFGKVLIDGRPVRGASVSLDSERTSIRAHTGDDGTYRIEGLTADSYEAFAVYEGPEGESIFRTIPFVLGEAEQKRIDLITDLTISGVALLSENGKLLPVTEDGFEVAARREGEEDRVSTRLLGEGRFLLHVDRPGIYELGLFDTSGFLERDAIQIDLTSRTTVDGVRFVVLRDSMDGRITLRVKDAESGEPVLEGNYNFRHKWTSGWGWFEDGTITFEESGVGTYRIVVESDRHMKTTLEVEITTTVKLIEREVALTPSNAVRISDLAIGSSAGKSGIRVDDVVLRYGDERTRCIEELQQAVRGTTPDQIVEVEILRDGQPLTLTIPGGRMGVIIANHRVE